MKNRFTVPKDLPAAACGRCIWWWATENEGNGKCHIWNEKRWYKCMVCPEYDFDSDINIAV